MPPTQTLATRRRLCAALATVTTAPAWAQFRVEISGVGATQLPVAVARFRDEDKAGPNAVIAAIIRADLERSGQFRNLDVAAALDETASPVMAEWRGRGADALLAGSVSRLADGRWDLRYKLWECNRVLDQLTTNHCVGFSLADFGNALPIDSNLDAAVAHFLGAVELAA